ncbi:MAG: NgoPII family restriction endonuclease [Muribaculaceae bacterium]|nr:NgoPII family restriction endonuclease [Muribaculaceae bacterium]
MSNILTAITAIAQHSSNAIITTQSNSHNRATQMGDALEDYVKKAFANCLNKDTDSFQQARSSVFSYIGNSSNPPDAMLKEGDAIEIKKIESLSTQIQLNSSYPKNKLYVDNPKICKACRECEKWDVKDMLYVVGHVNGKELKNIFFIYGDLYCDSNEIYENIESTIKSGLNSIDTFEFQETKELGRINKVDHLQITDLRIRGMWIIKSPFQHFKYLAEEISNFNFKLVALIPSKKYYSFDNVSDFELFCKENGVKILDKEIEDPKNPAHLISSKLIIF